MKYLKHLILIIVKIIMKFDFLYVQIMQSSIISTFLLKLLGIKIKGKIFIDYGFDFLIPANIAIGRHVSLGHYNKIWAFDNVVIGDYVQSAVGLTIIAGSHRNDNYKPKSNQQIEIGNGTWLGANVTILGSVKIGKGCIIGACSTVTKNIPDFSVAVGTPAKVIKQRIPSDKIMSPFGWYDLKDIS